MWLRVFLDFLRWRRRTWGLGWVRWPARRCVRCGREIPPDRLAFIPLARSGRPDDRTPGRLCLPCARAIPHAGETGEEWPGGGSAGA